MAGVSIDYYTRLEQGRNTHPGAAVLDALATALRLDDNERDHLRGLAINAAGRSARHRPRPVAVRPGLRQLLDTLRPCPAFLLDATGNILAANPEGPRLLVSIDDWPRSRRNINRYVFTHRAAKDLFVSWSQIAQDCVADLRTVVSLDPGSPELELLVAELSASSPEFAELWQHHDVRVNNGGARRFHHPTIGPFTLTSEVLAAVDGVRLLVFQAGNNPADRAAIVSLAKMT
jgi:hypothetical protein